MLLLLTIALVIVGAVSLLIGFVRDSLLPIYLSIGCSIVAGVVLVVFSRMSRRQAATPEQAPDRPPSTWGPSPAGGAPAVSERERPPVAYDEAPTVVGAGGAGTVAPAPAPVFAPVEDDTFPIEDYDALRVTEILPLLEDLDVDELELVQEREEQGKRRTTILARIDQLLVEPEETAPSEEPPVEEPDVFDAVPPVAAESDTAADAFPIEDYDELTVDEILDRLDELDEDELDMVAEREETGENRAEILDRIDEIFDEIDAGLEGEGPPPPPPAPVEEAVPMPPARKSPAKKAPAAKKSGAKKAPAAKKSGAKKAPAAKKSAAKKAPAAKKSPAKKSPARKSPAKKAPAKKSPAKKASGAKKR